MAEPSINSILRKTFSKASKEDWLRVAKKELNEKNSIEDLTWTIDGLSFLPYYDKSDVTTLNYLKDYQNVLMQGTSDQINSWENWPKISVSDSDAANQIALKLLN